MMTRNALMRIKLSPSEDLGSFSKTSVWLLHLCPLALAIRPRLKTSKLWSPRLMHRIMMLPGDLFSKTWRTFPQEEVLGFLLWIRLTDRTSRKKEGLRWQKVILLDESHRQFVFKGWCEDQDQLSEQCGQHGEEDQRWDWPQVAFRYLLNPN